MSRVRPPDNIPADSSRLPQTQATGRAGRQAGNCTSSRAAGGARAVTTLHGGMSGPVAVTEAVAFATSDYWWAQVTLASRLLLAMVLGVAALGKLIDPEGPEHWLGDARLLPHPIPKLVGVVFPWVEVAVCALLLLGVQPKVVGNVALAMFGGFTLLVLRRVAKGQTAECGCLGQILPTYAGWPELVRNLLLACAAGLMAWRPSPYLSADLVLDPQQFLTGGLLSLSEAIPTVLVVGLLAPVALVPGALVTGIGWALAVDLQGLPRTGTGPKS